jgi:MFS family permease
MAENSKKTLAFGILSLSLLTIMAGAAVSPALADIQKSLNVASPTLVKMILTLPAVFIIPTSYIVGKYAGIISKKKLALLGVLIYVSAGCGAVFADGIYFLLATRAVLGVAVGIIMPLAASLIADFFEGEDRMRMMGYNAAFANFGGILATFSSGLLASINWRYSFFVYGLGIPVFFIALMFIRDKKREATGTAQPKKKLPKETYYAAFPVFLVFLGFYTIPTNIAAYLISKDLGGPPEAGYAMAMATGTAMLMGLFTVKIRNVLGRAFIPAIAFTMLLTHALLGFTSSILTVNLALISNGFTLSMSVAYVMHRATETSKGHNVGATSLVTVLIFLGQFFSPLVMDFLGGIFGMYSPAFSFQAVAAGALTAFIFTLLQSFRQPRH